MAIAVPTNLYASGHAMQNTKGVVAWPLRAALVLTTSYVASSHMPCHSTQSVGIVVTCASVDYTSIETVIEGSLDGTTWFNIPSGRAVSADKNVQTLANLSAADTVGYLIPVTTAAACLFLRVSIKRTGGTATGTVAVTAYGGGAL